MKFGKEFVAQMVPEWQEAYMDYKCLKKHLKEIQRFKQKNAPGPKRSITLYRAFSGLTQMVNPPRAQKSPDVENQVILARNVRREDGCERSETQFLMVADAGGEHELVYFEKLDDEFNKVLKFYIGKVEEVMKEAAELNKQMEALVAFRVKVERPEGWSNSLEETTQLASDVAASRAALFATTPALRAISKTHLEVIDEEQSSSQGRKIESGDDSKDGVELGDDKDETEMKPMSAEIQECKQNWIGEKRPAPLEILQRVKFNTSEETPRSTIKGFLNFPKQTELKFSKDNLKKAEDQLKKAFVEFYHKLRLLKSYSFLNIMAFSKIMKKYDKIASRNASKTYMKMVDNSYIGSSDKVSKLMERVEVIFIKHFSNSNRSKGMQILRLQRQRERHRTTFYTGFLFGCTFALIMALVLIIRARYILATDIEERVKYMETMFPLYSLFGLIVLHMLMYAGNIYFWRRYRVNYPFIFGFKQGTELGYKEVLLLGFSLSVLALCSVLANQDMELHPITRDYEAITELLPLVLLLLLVATMVGPLNILYRSSRHFLLVSVFHCVLAPLYKVTLPDFFLADQFTSQVQALRSLEFYICYYGWGDYKRRQNNCTDSAVFITFSFIIAAIPFMCRLLQCLRRLYDEKDPMQGYNALKYLSTVIAVCARTAYSHNEAATWKLVALIASVIATIVSTYWDIVLDWGLLQRKSKNRWLRDKLLIPHKSVYFVAMVLNVLLRLAWMQTVMKITISSLHKQALIALVASLEIIRRGIWNFFRLENEHLNNVGKFRAFKSVPLPFNYDQDEDKEE